MPKFTITSAETVVKKVDGELQTLITKAGFDRFNISVLGLGDVRKPAKPTDALAAVFDLQGFTNFCKQIDPQLSVPRFLSEYLEWLMARLRQEMIHKTHKQGIEVYSSLPFFVKFLGDGLLVLWDCEDMHETGFRNVVYTAHLICQQYATKFYPQMTKKVVEPPPALRCGLARGIVFSVGDGHDYVGSCINMAARIQKLPGLFFAFNTRGINLEDEERGDFFKKEIAILEVAIRGIGDHELVAVRKDEFERLKRKEKSGLTLVSS